MLVTLLSKDTEIPKPDVIDKDDTELAYGLYLVRDRYKGVNLVNYKPAGWSLVLENIKIEE